MFHSLFIGLIEYIQYLTKYFYTLFLHKYLFLFLFPFKTSLKHSFIKYFATLSFASLLRFLIDCSSPIQYILYLNFKSFFTETQNLKTNISYSVINFNNILFTIVNVSLRFTFLKIYLLLSRLI